MATLHRRNTPRHGHAARRDPTPTAPRRNPWPDNAREVQHLQSREQKRNHITAKLDSGGFGKLVVAVAASGFFTDSYNLFSTNVTVPTLEFLYFGDNPNATFLITCMTLVGTMVGQILFGLLADLYGRQRLYGVELVIVIVATICIMMAAEGMGGWMKMTGILTFWRFIMGIGIGETPQFPACCSLFARCACAT